jgi:hypothetical protein
MAVLHFALALVTGYALVVGVQLADRWLLQTVAVRARGWNYATWGAAVYWLGELSLLGWCFVARFRFDPWLRHVGVRAARSRSARVRRLFGVAPGRDVELPRALRVVRGALGLLTGVLLVVAVAIVEGAIEQAIFQDLLSLPPYTHHHR